MISVKITAYNRHTAGPLRVLEFHLNGLVCSSGREDQFKHGTDHAHSIISGLRALEPLTDFSIRQVNTDAHGNGTSIDGVSLFDIQAQAERDLENKGAK